MTREEAISEWTFRSNHIKKWLDEYGEEPSIRHYVELIDMAIEALKGGDAEVNETKSPYMQQSRHDDGRMTREEAREILTHNWTRVDNPNYSESELDEAFFMAIEALQDRPQGEWKHTITWQPYCSNCEYVFDEDEEYSPFWKFCPMCGAEMADNSLFNDITESLNDAIESQNDVIEVVRCRDCRWWNSETKGCKRNPSVEAWYETDFCKYGERQCNYFGERVEECE